MNVFEKMARNEAKDKFSFVSSKPLGKASVSESGNNDKGGAFRRIAEEDRANQEKKFDFLKTAKDIGEQAFSKGVSGAGGAYGNILEAFHLQPQRGAEVPYNQEVSDIKSQIVDKMNRGESPSYGEMLLLSEEDPIALGSRFPTSPDVQQAIESISGIGEGKTPAGRVVGRGAEFVGETLASGGGLKALLSTGGAGLAGQTIRELGGPEWAASATEIVGSLAPSAFSKKLLPGKGAKDIVEAGRKLGLSESQITPLIQGETKASTLSKIARKGQRTKEHFAGIKEKLGDSYSRLKSSPSAQKSISGSDRIKLSDDFLDIHSELSKTLAASPDREAALKFVETAIDSLNNKDVTPEHLINFWQDINKSVNWNSINGGKKALASLKKPVYNMLEKRSPQLAKDFEMTNDLYTKYAQISKKLKPDIIDSFVNKAEIMAAPTAALALVTGNPWLFAGIVSEPLMRTLATEMLINPYLQNIAKKLVVNFNQGSIKGIEQSVSELYKYMSKKHPNEKWEFLTQETLSPED